MKLRPYFFVISARFRTLLQYRTAAFAGLVTQIFWGSIKLMVLGAFFAVATEPPPMSFQQIVVYVWLGQVLLAMLPWNADSEIQQMFTSGSVAYELLRPLDLYAFWFARTMAFRSAPTLLRMIPGLIFAYFIVRVIGLEEWVLARPASVYYGLAFVASILMAFILSCAITMLINISVFWTIESRGVVAIINGLVTVFSGMILPLPLFPGWMQGVLYWQPFRGLCDVPYRIYSGNIPMSEIPLEILHQLGWTVLLIALGMVLLGSARRKLVVQGG